MPRAGRVLVLGAVYHVTTGLRAGSIFFKMRGRPAGGSAGEHAAAGRTRSIGIKWKTPTERLLQPPTS